MPIDVDQLQEEREECGCGVCCPDDVPREERGYGPEGVPLVGDYPSVRNPPHLGPVFLLLDTCVVQTLRWARTRAPALDDAEAWSRLRDRYGAPMRDELRALTGLRAGIDGALSVATHQGSPFLVGRSSWDEICQAPAARRAELVVEWRLWRSRHWTFDEDGEAVPDPQTSTMPERLGWPGPGQLRLVTDDEPEPQEDTQLGPFRHRGDVALIREVEALEDVNAILTVDLASFWRHRGWLYDRGIEVWRPSDLCWAMTHELSYYRGEYGFQLAWPARSRDGRYPLPRAA